MKQNRKIIKRMIMQGLFFLVLLIVAQSCKINFGGSTYVREDSYIKISPEKSAQENYTSSSLRRFMSENPGASVVVRDFKAAQGAGISADSESSPLCLLLEDALMKKNFNVRDRIIFENIMSKMGEIVNYEQLSKKTGTDLIFEVNFGYDKYNVKEYYAGSETKGFTYKKEIGKTSKGYPIYDYNAPMTYLLYGYHVKIKIIMLRDNKIGGTYTYYYTPCDKTKGGCKISKMSIGDSPFLRYIENNEYKPDASLSDREPGTNEIEYKEIGNFLSKVIDKMFEDIEKK